MQKLYSMGQVVHLLGIPQHKITYAISSGYLPEAKVHFVGKRCFDINDLRRIARYFGVDLPEGGGDVQV